MLDGIKTFVMNLVEAIQKSNELRAQRYTYQYRLDRFIESKKPTSAAEVDHWIKEFDRRQHV